MEGAPGRRTGVPPCGTTGAIRQNSRPSENRHPKLVSPGRLDVAPKPSGTVLWLSFRLENPCRLDAAGEPGRGYRNHHGDEKYRGNAQQNAGARHH